MNSRHLKTKIYSNSFVKICPKEIAHYRKKSCRHILAYCIINGDYQDHIFLKQQTGYLNTKEIIGITEQNI